MNTLQCAHALFPCTFITETSTTQVTGIWIWYAWTCVIWVFSAEWMTYCTYYINIYCLHYVLIYVFQDHTKWWMICYRNTFHLTPFTVHMLVTWRHVTLINKPCFTHITSMWTVLTLYALSNVHVKMFLQVSLITVGLTTHTAKERTLSSMQTLMFLQVLLITEWLITHCTGVLRPLFVCASVCGM